MPISQDHPLRRLFGQLVGRHFQDDAGIAEYVSGIAARFTRCDPRSVMAAAL
ncbi:MAG TPA: hypothetical protein VEW69_11045 [Alphaproteobacteria bacterium]|nr:hypothetical protein [Alphaproteobacteria bacterium]